MADTLRKYAGVIVMIVALVLGGLYYYQVRHEEDRASCQSRFNTAFAANLTIRSTLSGQRQDAEDNLLTTVSSLVLHPAKTAAEKTKASQDYVAAFETYQSATDAYNAAKAANPLPSLPNC